MKKYGKILEKLLWIQESEQNVALFVTQVEQRQGEKFKTLPTTISNNKGVLVIAVPDAWMWAKCMESYHEYLSIWRSLNEKNTSIRIIIEP